MEMEEERDTIFKTMFEQIKEVTKIPDEISKIQEMLRTAEKQSQRKEIKTKSKSSEIRKFFILLKIRLYYGIHWKKPLYPFRLARNILLGKLFNMLKLKKFVLRVKYEY